MMTVHFRHLVLSLAVVLPGVCGVYTQPQLKLYGHCTSVMTFSCSYDKDLMNYHRRSDFRKMQIAHLDESNNRTVLATLLDDGSTRKNLQVIQRMGERSIHVTGGIDSSSGVATLHFLVFEFELDVNMWNYGTYTCSVDWFSDQSDPWVKRLNLFPYDTLPKTDSGFEIRRSSSTDLTCVASIPAYYASVDTYLSIFQASNSNIMAIWYKNNAAFTKIPFKAVYSPLHAKGDIHHARVRLLDVPDEATDYQCTVSSMGRKFSSQVVTLEPGCPVSCGLTCSGMYFCIIACAVIAAVVGIVFCMKCRLAKQKCRFVKEKLQCFFLICCRRNALATEVGEQIPMNLVI
ncbi:uncharacterized protein LOC143301129 [Babylonia areolata]|uniref:uncharacterized protein LOC143301129 n=1 Tax=Babylonia areolata TaxID=304850 RepID=UPI003FD254F6